MRFDAVQTIKDRLTMRDVLEHYGYTYKRRIPCPIHNGRDENFEVKERSFCCHSHCGGGDVITFVQKLFGLTFPETLKKIDADFRLNIYNDVPFEDRRRSYYQSLALKAKRERQQAEKEKINQEFWKAFDEWKRLDDNKRKYAPKSPDEELHPLFIEALHNIKYQEYLLDSIEERKRKYE